VSFAAITLCVACQGMFIVVVYFVIHSVRKLLDTPSYVTTTTTTTTTSGVMVCGSVKLNNLDSEQGPITGFCC
jgi:hypothetical protein